METQNKQWVCHPALDNSGQLGPEDLSSNSKNLQNRLGINDKQQTIPNKEQEVISDIKNKNGLDQFFVHQVEDAIWLVDNIMMPNIANLFHLFYILKTH